MVLGAPNEENVAIETGPSFCFTAPQAPAGASGWDVAGPCYNRESAGLCSTETLKPGGTAPKYREKDSILQAQPVAWAPHMYHPNACNCLAMHRAGVLAEQSWGGSSPPGRGLLHPHCDPCAATMCPHAARVCLGSSASSAASKPGPLCTPEPQHPTQSLAVPQTLRHHGDMKVRQT